MRYKATNNKGEYGMTGIFLEIKDDLRRDIHKLDPADRAYIDVATFTMIMNLYIEIMLQDVIDGAICKLYNKLGFLYVVQSLCIRYNPTKAFFVHENGQLVRKVDKVQLVNGRLAHFFWDCGKKWRMYRFKPASRFKKKMLDKFYAGFEYAVLDLKKYGRNASDTYIQYFK